MTATSPAPDNSLPYVLAPFSGVVIGAAAVFVQKYVAPVGLFPAVVGAIVGAAVAGLLHFAISPRLRTRLILATVAALACTATIHYGSYLHAKAAFQNEVELQRQFVHQFGKQETTPQPVPFQSFTEYVDYELDVGRKLGPLPVRGGRLIFWWSVDALLIWLGAAVTTSSLRNRSNEPAAGAAASSPTTGGSA